MTCRRRRHCSTVARGLRAERLAVGLAAGLIGIGCAGQTGRSPVTAGQGRELRIAHDHGIGGPGPLLLVTIGPAGAVSGAAFVRARRLDGAWPDSILNFYQAEREARFARVGCTEPVEAGNNFECRVRFRGSEPDWAAALRVIDRALVADSAAERAEILARQPVVRADGTILIRGRNDGDSIRADIRDERGMRRSWYLGQEAATALGALVDSLVASATTAGR